MTPNVSRFSTNRLNSGNGLWSCRLNGGVSGAVPVGLHVSEKFWSYI